METRVAHEELKKFCEKHSKLTTNAGIGISIDIIEKLIKNQIEELTGRFASMQSNTLFKNISVFYTAIVDPNINLRLDVETDPSNTQRYIPVLILENINLSLTGLMDGKPMAKIDIQFPGVVGGILLENRRITFRLLTEKHQIILFNKIWESDSSIKKHFETKYGFNSDTWSELEMHFRAISIFSATDIAASFLDSIVLPDLYKVFVGIIFEDDAILQVGASGRLLMLTATSKLNFAQCPKYNSSGDTNTITTTTTETKTSGDTEYTKWPTVETEIDPTSRSLQYEHENEIEGMERISTSDLFLFTPAKLLQFNFSVVKPSITASDSGRKGPIYWRYSVTNALKSISLNLNRLWPLEFKLDLPSEVTGQAGAGVKIGCIRYEAIGAMFDGIIEPFEVFFFIYFDWKRKEIVFESKLGKVKAKNFSFRTFPRMDFPLSEILDFILARVAEFIIKDKSNDMLNVTRISIANFGILQDVGLLRNVMSGYSDKMSGGSGDDVTIGVEFKN